MSRYQYQVGGTLRLDLDYQFLAASQECDRQEVQKVKELPANQCRGSRGRSHLMRLRANHE